MQKNANGGMGLAESKGLSGQQRKVLELYRGGVVKPSEMAAAMRISTKAARSYIKRALEILGAKNLEHALLIIDVKPVEQKKSEFIPLDMQSTITRPPDRVHEFMGK